MARLETLVRDEHGNRVCVHKIGDFWGRLRSICDESDVVTDCGWFGRDAETPRQNRGTCWRWGSVYVCVCAWLSHSD